ncbi:glutamate-5-semialdehyde dehydrogenase [Taklimakanibacter albus]|uniref:Glutamate-5-semialdehyde dehydrogenase n=1 Tax=Taklimakanibacter albus TaxID=2800327 RepID=A0ACC5R981_9HYPH|nr:glutamate-5-semialdehyde dehydrogenase [Aestuariivirga sp. YIM B02566]MBK1869035.1 glutamate-5-semialdehyde dehydrogenase [Aestuariivirga sp. YIM B02566]
MNKIESTSDTRAALLAMGKAARRAARQLALASSETKNKALGLMAQAIRADAALIARENAADLEAAKHKELKSSFVDRLTLTPERIEAMAKGLDEIAALPDPVGHVTESWTRPNGLRIARVRVPIGVIGIIYESRPNVTADAGALAMKSGNAAILRGGSDSYRSSAAIVAALQRGLAEAGLPKEAIQMVPTMDRDAVGLLLSGLDGTVDLIVPRGGKSLVARVQQEARVPVFSHLEGICHVYVDKAADLDMAREIVRNAKMRRTGICGAAETILVDSAVAATHLKPLIATLADAGCEVRGCAETQAADPRVTKASEEDWSTEYLDAIVSMKVVAGLDAAMDHIARYGSQHTDAIITADEVAARRFLTEVDSAITLHNASTQFADGGEFGFGAEIGIATGRLHARGPVGLEQLTTFKYQVSGTGQIRP